MQTDNYSNPTTRSLPTDSPTQISSNPTQNPTKSPSSLPSSNPTTQIPSEDPSLYQSSSTPTEKDALEIVDPVITSETPTNAPLILRDTVPEDANKWTMVAILCSVFGSICVKYTSPVDGII